MIGIYKITNKTNNKSYIGQSIHIEDRWMEHMSKKSSSLISRAIQKYGMNNFTFEIIEECSQEELDKKEIHWIKYYKSFEEGYNLTLGGKQGFLYDVEEIFNDYLKTDNMIQTSRNFGCSINTVRRICHSFGVDKSYLQLEKAVKQIDPQTLTIIKTFNCLQDAADEVGVSKSAISFAVSGKNKTCKGFIWRALEDEEEIVLGKPVKMHKNKVQQINPKTLEVIQEFDSMTQAYLALGKNPKGQSGISRVCSGKGKTFLGYAWKKI